MKSTTTVIKWLVLLLALLLLTYINIKTRNNIGLIAAFKYETLETIAADSSGMKHKYILLNDETTKFSGAILEDTLHVHEAIAYLIGVMGLFIVVELSFLRSKRKMGNK